MRTVLVTGGAGFIGSYVVEDLLARGYTAHVLDTRGRAVAGATTILGDVRDATSTGEAIGRADGVIHLAGVLGTAEMVANPRPAIDANVLGAINVFEATARHGIPMVNIATGNHWMDNTYAITKDAADRFARMYNAFRGGRITTVRAFDAYGPRQTPPAPYGLSRVRKVIPSFACRALSGEPIEIYGDGSQVIDLIHASDVARVLVDALERTERDGPVAETIEAGSGIPITVLQTAERVIEYAGRGSIAFLPMRPGEQTGAAIVAKAQLAGAVPLSVGLPQTIAYYAHVLG